MAPSRPIFDVTEDTSGRYFAKLIDEFGLGIPAASMNSVTLTLYDTASQTIINNRDAQNVLNLNQVTIDGEGNLVWLWLPLDMPRLHDTRAPETHTGLWTVVWNGGNSQILHEISFRVHRVTFPA